MIGEIGCVWVVIINWYVKLLSVVNSDICVYCVWFFQQGQCKWIGNYNVQCFVFMQCVYFCCEIMYMIVGVWVLEYGVEYFGCV